MNILSKKTLRASLFGISQGATEDKLDEALKNMYKGLKYPSTTRVRLKLKPKETK